MSDVDTTNADESQWRDHDAKRRRISLKTDLLQTQADSLRTLFDRGKGKLTDMTIRACVEGNFKESKVHSVWMDDDPPVALEIFLEFLYTLDDFAAVKCLRSGHPAHKVQNLLDLCKIADKYDQKFLLEQVFQLFDTHSRYEPYPLEMDDLLLAYKEIKDMGDTPWLSRIRRAVLTCLLKPEKLKHLDTRSKKILQENMDLGFSLIELLADRCEDHEKKLSRQSIIIDDDSIPDETELARMGY